MEKTAISQLQELMISQGVAPEYECISQTGPPHQMVFVMQCVVGDVSVTGTARSKKEAKQEAARAALAALGEQAAGPVQPQAGNMYVSLLRELCVEYRLPAVETCEVSAWGPPHRPEFAVRVAVGPHERMATAHTKKAARHMAAEQLYLYLRECLPTITADFEEDQALVRAHDRVMERFVETRGWRPDMALRISDYHLALVEALGGEQRAAVATALESRDAGEAVRGAADAAGLTLQWTELPASKPLPVLQVEATCPLLAFYGFRPEDASDAAAHYLRLALELHQATTQHAGLGTAAEATAATATV